MLDSGVICPSQSVWCNDVVLVQKKDRGLCVCIDFCCLNTHMKKDSYPMPRIQEVLESLVGRGHFSCLDLKSGFWQIKMDELSKQFREKVTLDDVLTIHHIYPGQLRLLQVLPHALWAVQCATSQRLMQNCLGELNLTYCLIYLDDIIIFSQTAQEHVPCLHVVFDQFREHNLKLKPSKCNFFRNEITYLAHRVLKDGVCPINSNLEAIIECPPPQTYMEVHVVLSLMGYYRRFIKGFACIAQPLNEYLVREGAAGSQSGCHRGGHEGLQSVETGMHDSSRFGVH